MDRLEPVIQHYAWGDHDYLANLQGRAPSGLPEAELWMGAYPGAASRLVDDGRTLDEVIAADPVAGLGSTVYDRFGRLPFLAKVLAVAEPLSIQVHPSLQQARDGFAREEASGPPADDPRRIYRDDNHKPEIVCALTRFEAMCGFRSLAASRELFARLDHRGLDPVRARLSTAGSEAEVLADLLGWLFHLDAATAAALVAAAAEACAAAAPDDPDAAALAWIVSLAQRHPADAGVLVALLLHHVVLEPGEALVLPARNLHVYLQGSVVELVAAGDNVARAGLTTKHVDVEEVLAIVDCRPLVPIVEPPAGEVTVYSTGVADFGLTRVAVTGEVSFEVQGPEIVLVVEGAVEVVDAIGRELSLRPGESVWIAAHERRYRLRGDALVFRCTVGS